MPETRLRWTCARCGRVLGEIVATSVIIAPRADRHHLWVAPMPVEARCKCGMVNVMDQRRAQELRTAA